MQMRKKCVQHKRKVKQRKINIESGNGNRNGSANECFLLTTKARFGFRKKDKKRANIKDFYWIFQLFFLFICCACV